MLSEDTAKRRIEGLRILRGYTQDELDALGAKEGLGKQELSRTERGELPVTKTRRLAFARLLSAPEAFFLEENIDRFIWGDPRLAQISVWLDDLINGLPGAETLERAELEAETEERAAQSEQSDAASEEETRGQQCQDPPPPPH